MFNATQVALVEQLFALPKTVLYISKYFRGCTELHQILEYKHICYIIITMFSQGKR